MVIWVIRHGCAGHKHDWDGPDDERPLDPVGVDQANALATLLAGEAPTGLWSSPAARCVETLDPLSALTGLPIRRDDALRPGEEAALLARLEDPVAAGAVLCTHGEVMEPALRALRNGGAEIVGDRSDDELLLKGAAWKLEQRDRRWRLDLRVPVPSACPLHATQR